jgi:hypothetical protein
MEREKPWILPGISYVTNLSSSATPVDLDSTYPRGCISPIIFIIPSLSHQSYSKKKHYSKNLGHLFVSSKKNYKGLVSTYPVGWGCKKSWGSVNQRLWHRSNCDLATKTPGKFDSNLMWIEK